MGGHKKSLGGARPPWPPHSDSTDLSTFKVTTFLLLLMYFFWSLLCTLLLVVFRSRNKTFIWLHFSRTFYTIGYVLDFIFTNLDFGKFTNHKWTLLYIWKVCLSDKKLAKKDIKYIHYWQLRKSMTLIKINFLDACTWTLCMLFVCVTYVYVFFVCFVWCALFNTKKADRPEGERPWARIENLLSS